MHICNAHASMTMQQGSLCQEALSYLSKTPHGIPHAISDLSRSQEAEHTRCIVRAKAHVEVLEGQQGTYAGVLEPLLQPALTRTTMLTSKKRCPMSALVQPVSYERGQKEEAAKTGLKAGSAVVH
jgi:hypothetical protein